MRALVPPRGPDAHKGRFGHLTVAAGARGFTGAAMLTAHAALRSGPGLVSLALPSPCVSGLSPALVECMSLPLPATGDATFDREAADPLLAFLEGKDALALGPGITQHERTASFVQRVLVACPLPVVLDADGLNCAAKVAHALDENPGPRVLTPHPGEMARLTGTTTSAVQQDREKQALEYAQRHRCVLVLKGYRTVIAAPDGRLAINPTGNPGMATGGSGDVLTGIVGALLAQGLDPYDAACLAAYVHGTAGDLAAEACTQTAMKAGDIIEMLPHAWRALGAP